MSPYRYITGEYNNVTLTASTQDGYCLDKDITAILNVLATTHVRSKMTQLKVYIRLFTDNNESGIPIIPFIGIVRIPFSATITNTVISGHGQFYDFLAAAVGDEMTTRRLIILPLAKALANKSVAEEPTFLYQGVLNYKVTEKDIKDLTSGIRSSEHLQNPQFKLVAIWGVFAPDNDQVQTAKMQMIFDLSYNLIPKY